MAETGTTVLYEKSIEYTHPTPPEAVSEPVATYETRDDIEALIRATFPEDASRAVAIAKAESGSKLSPTAYNPEWHYDRHGKKLCQGSFGVFQIACVHHLEDPTALFDVELNIEKAERINAQSGWRPWGAYSDQRYLTYLQ